MIMTMNGTNAAAAQPQAIEEMLALGLAYASGHEVPLDYIEAHKWFSVAAARGSREAVMRRLEIAQEMSAADIAQAQRAARAWAQLH